MLGAWSRSRGGTHDFLRRRRKPRAAAACPQLRLEASIVGPTQKDGDDEFTAVATAMTAQGLRNIRERYGIAAPVTLKPHGHPRSGHARVLPRLSQTVRLHPGQRQQVPHRDEAIDAIPETIAQELRAFHQTAPQVP